MKRSLLLLGALAVIALGAFQLRTADAVPPASEHPDGYLPVQSARGRDELFALRVRGESMRDAAILPGDVVIVHRQESALSGEIVVALVEDEATVKRLKLRAGRIELHPANPAFEPIVPDPAQVRILGKVIEVRRYLEGGALLPPEL